MRSPCGGIGTGPESAASKPTPKSVMPVMSRSYP